MSLKESGKTSAIPYKSAEKVLSEKHGNPLAFISRKKHRTDYSWEMPC